MVFEYIDNDGSQLTNWYNGKVSHIENKRTNAAIIEWDSECVGEDFQNEVGPFADYLKYMFTEKSSNQSGGSRKQLHKVVLPYNELIAEMCYPVQRGNHQTHYLSIRLGELIVDTMILELRGKYKYTWDYISSYDGRYSQKNITKEDRQETTGLRPTTVSWKTTMLLQRSL